MLIAHDPTTKDVLPFFPGNSINDWKEKNWKEALHWGFLSELPYSRDGSSQGKSVREPVVDGLYKDGRRTKDLCGNKV